MDKKHEKKKFAVQITGIIMLGVGIILEIVGFAALINDPSSFLWILIIVGFLLAFCSMAFIAIGFRREFAKYEKDEMMPLVKEYNREITPPKTTCKSCGAVNDGDSKFCKQCGKSFYKNCPFCGAELAGDDKFCSSCGKEYPTAVASLNDDRL